MGYGDCSVIRLGNSGTAMDAEVIFRNILNMKEKTTLRSHNGLGVFLCAGKGASDLALVPFLYYVNHLFNSHTHLSRKVPKRRNAIFYYFRSFERNPDIAETLIFIGFLAHTIFSKIAKMVRKRFVTSLFYWAFSQSTNLKNTKNHRKPLYLLGFTNQIYPF